MKVRDLPSKLLTTYAATIVAAELPHEWLDLPFVEFLVWLDRAREDRAKAVEMWNALGAAQTEAALMLSPILERCPSLSLAEAADILKNADRERLRLAIAKMFDSDLSSEVKN